jgi:hypothetical protein
VPEILQTKLGEHSGIFSRASPTQHENPSGDALFLTFKVTGLLKAQVENKKRPFLVGNGRFLFFIKISAIGSMLLEAKLVKA